jgi:hypothetical protein
LGLLEGLDFMERCWGGMRAAVSALYRFFGILVFPFQADYLSQPGPKTPGQVTSVLTYFCMTVLTIIYSEKVIGWLLN